MDTLERNIKDIFKKFKFPKDMIMTRHDKLVYDNSTHCHICNEELGEDRVYDLRLISDDTKQHYCWIMDIGKLLSLLSSKDGNVRHVCFRYLNALNSKESLASHHECCKSYEAIKIELPEDGSKIYFKNHNRSMLVPFIVYADFESFIPQLSTCQPNPEMSYTNQYQKHIPSVFCYHIKCFDDTLDS